MILSYWLVPVSLEFLLFDPALISLLCIRSHYILHSGCALPVQLRGKWSIPAHSNNRCMLVNQLPSCQVAGRFNYGHCCVNYLYLTPDLGARMVHYLLDCWTVKLLELAPNREYHLLSLACLVPICHHWEFESEPLPIPDTETRRYKFNLETYAQRGQRGYALT